MKEDTLICQKKKKTQNHAFFRLCALDPRSSSDHTPLSCQSLGHSEQMLAQPAGHADLETISKGVFFGSVGTQLSPPPPPRQRRPSAAGFRRAGARLGVRERLPGSIVCHSSLSEKVAVNQSRALGNTALNGIQWADWVSDGWFTYIQPELSDRETLTRRVEEVRVG